VHVQSFLECPAAPSQPDIERAAADRYGSLLTQSHDHLVEGNVLRLFDQRDDELLVGIKERTAASALFRRRQPTARALAIQAMAVEMPISNRTDIFVSIPGVSQITAFTLLIEMPELGEMDEKAAAALSELAPMSRQSGRWTGRAFIAGGRAIVRHALYMPALVACRFNPDLKTKYEDLTKAGKPPNVAITAVMRKLIVLANALLRKNRKWEPKPA
jgi:transposase